jgi:hypothetical protein
MWMVPASSLVEHAWPEDLSKFSKVAGPLGWIAGCGISAWANN